MLTDKIIAGDVRAAARLIRRIDDGERDVIPELRALYPYSGRAHVVGFTGSPGVGKSTIVDRLVSKLRSDDKTVGVLAVDPTSPFSGGAILGDRIRMQSHAVDQGVFIRSMATRGAFGGLSRATADAILVLEAMGRDVVIVETVGVGQDEVDIAQSAQTTVLVTIPGMGDEIQAIKAGLMEIGDIFVVNKADRDGLEKTMREIRFMLEMSTDRFDKTGWVPPVIPTQAVSGEGIDELNQAILDHRRILSDLQGEQLRRKQEDRVLKQLTDLFRDGLFAEALRRIGGPPRLEETARRIALGNGDPYGACAELVDELLGGANR